jgi:hypothetical protein
MSPKNRPTTRVIPKLKGKADLSFISPYACSPPYNEKKTVRKIMNPDNGLLR